jgi:sucrose phosphorylase
LLHEFQTNTGAKRVWTTFSEDQVDLNAATPEVLLALISVLLFYVQQGARYIRLDAIAYLWKEIGTSCIHLWQTHEVVKLMRDVLDVVAPHIILITETNVPHEENISYLGSGADEAQLVYQFALPPLLVHTFRTGNAEAINGWAQTLARVGTRTSYFNFTASHDGIGVTPVRGLLPAQEAAALEDLTVAHGGLVSFKNNSDGSKSAYELNITYFDAITNPAITATESETAVKRFLCSQAIMLALMGVPGVYFHSLFGSRNDLAGVKRTTHARSINREKVAASDLQMALQDPASLRSQVFSNYMHLLRVRAQEPAFHPQGEQRVLALHPGVVALERTSTDGQSVVAALHNVTASAITVRLNTTPRRDLLNTTTTFGSPTVPLAPYQVMWLKMA